MKTEFSEKEINFIKERQYPFNFDNPSDEDWDALYDWAADTLMYEGFDKDYNANEVGDICEDIIDIAWYASEKINNPEGLRKEGLL